MKPENALNGAIHLGTLDSGRRAPNKPGAVIEKLSQEYRDALKDLTSDNINESTHFKEYWIGVSQGLDADYKRQYLKMLNELKLEFNKTLKK